MKMSKTFTGIKDADRLILNSLSDRDLLSTCSTSKYLYSLCDDEFFRNRLFRIYSDSIKYKPTNMSWKNYYLNVIYWVNKMLEDQNFIYKTGDPKKYFDLFYNETYTVDQLKHTAENGYTDLLDHLINKYDLTGYNWVIVEGAAKSNNREIMKKYNYLKHLSKALKGAVEGEQSELIKELINDGAARIRGIGIMDDLNQSFREAVSTGNKEIIEILIDNGADDFNGALSRAVKTGNKELINYFLINYPNIDKKYGLFGAAYAGNLELFDFFLEKMKGTQVDGLFFDNLQRTTNDGKREKMKPGNHEKIINKIIELEKKLFG